MEDTFEKVLEQVKKHKDEFSYYNAVYFLVDNEDEKPKKWEMAKRLKKLIWDGIKDGSECSKELEELYTEVLLLEARGLRFDSYMQYLELDRAAEDRYWIPRRKQLMPVCIAIQKLIDGELDMLTISLPPGTGKSTMEIFLHSMLIGHNPASPCLASAHSSKLTNHIYDGVLQIINDRTEYRWHQIFPGNEDIITNAKETTIDIGKKHPFPSLTCRSIDGSLTGATRCEQILTADDLVSGIEEALSPVRLQTKWDKYTNDLKTRKKKHCPEMHLATRWSVHDPIGRLRVLYEGDDRFLSLVIPALDENRESNFDYQYDVGFDTDYFLDMERNLDPISFGALFMNNPIEREGLLFPSDSLKRYYDLPDGKPDAIISVCDTKDTGSDFCSMPIAYVYGNYYYIEDVVFDDGLPEQFTPRLVNKMIDHKIQMSKFESNSAGGVIATNIQNALKEKNAKCSIVKEFTKGNKETKIFVNSEWVKEHCLFKDSSLYEPQSDYGKFMSQLVSYTHVGKNPHDDAPDSMAMLAEFVDTMHGYEYKVFKRPF